MAEKFTNELKSLVLVGKQGSVAKLDCESEFSDGCESHSEENQWLSKIVTELVYLLTINSKYVQHLVGNVLVVVSEFVAAYGSKWDAFIHFLCASLELAINTLLSGSLTPSLHEADDSNSSSSSFALALKDKLKNANWSAVAGIVRVLRHILKDLAREDDVQFIIIYFDAVTSCLLNVPWDSFTELFVAPDGEAQKTSTADNLVRRFLFLGCFIQFLCSLVEQSGAVEASGGSKDKHSVVSLAIVLVPKLLSWCSGKWGDTVNKCIFQYLRYKILVLMIRLSFQTSLDCSVLVSWLQLIHNYFSQLLRQPITSLELVQNDSLEGSPFLSSISDEEVNNLSSLHVKRRAIFLLLRCSFSLINLRGSTDEKCTCGTKILCLRCNTNVELKYCGRQKGLIELSNWLQSHLPTKIFLNSEMYLQKRVDFTLSFLKLYMHEDDLLFKVLLQLLCVPFPAEEQFQKEKAALQDAEQDMLFHVSNLFNPVHLFHLFLAELHYDHQVLLDYLISKDTGTSCAEYLLRCLRAVCDSWCLFVEFSMGGQWVNQSSHKKRKKLCDSTSQAEEHSVPVKKDEILASIGEECKKGYKKGGEQYRPRRKPYIEAKECLLALKVSVESLHQKNLFPYNPNVLLKRLRRFQELWVKAEQNHL
ncbi:uncharacterized protein LOC21403182 [Morus notabilis]|uniref:uncharacterized protein LOC21403182 n=1 Tax=Morus notabilis TaxID=981085 RepID=UPI000CED6F10|nr:uncharacterized protein LOC21403182 [Morus notabilis]